MRNTGLLCVFLFGLIAGGCDIPISQAENKKRCLDTYVFGATIIEGLEFPSAEERQLAETDNLFVYVLCLSHREFGGSILDPITGD